MSGLTFMRCDECNGFGFFPNGDRCGICNGYGSLPIRAVESASPPRVPGPSAQFAKVGVQSGPGQPTDIVERLERIRSMIGKMCREGRPPAMTVPADPTRDEDLFIADAADEAAAEIRRLRAEERNRKVDLGGVLELLIERNGKVDLTSDVVSQVRALLSAERRAGIEAAAKYHVAHEAACWAERDAEGALRHEKDAAAIRALADAPLA